MKLFALVDVPPAFVTEIVPLVAPAGTVTRMKFAVSTLKLAPAPLIVTLVVPTKCEPCSTKVDPGLPLDGRKLMIRACGGASPASITKNVPLDGGPLVAAADIP